MADLNNFAQAMNAGFSCIFDCKLMSSAGIWQGCNEIQEVKSGGYVRYVYDGATIRFYVMLQQSLSKYD